MKKLYLALAVAGAVVPYVFFIQHIQGNGADPGVFVRAVFANPAASGFTADLFISSFVFWVVMLQRRRAGRGPKPWLYILLNLTIGLSCALPAYLYANEVTGESANPATSN